MIFGNSVTLTNGGQLLGRLFEAGYSLALMDGNIDTLKTPGGWASAIQQALSSKPGQNGGAPKSANKSNVAGIAAVNSTLTDLVPPIPMPPLNRGEEFANQIVREGAYDSFGQDENGDPVVVRTGTGISAGIMSFTATDGTRTDGISIPVLTLPFGNNGALTEIGFDARGKPIAGVILVNYFDCPGCTVTFDSDSDTATLFDGPLGQVELPFPVTSEIVSHEDATLPNNVQYCACAFLDWGLWSAKGSINYGGIGIALDVEGQWATGDITTPAQLDQLAQLQTTTATFEGTAIGTVSPDIFATGNTYTAAGDLNMTWNFATRDGQLDVTGFDGRDFGGAMTAPPGENGFGGFIDDNNNGFGFAQGVFVNDGPKPAEGIMGNFVLDDGTWGATGILIGEKVP
jgi:hypothetical protein